MGCFSRPCQDSFALFNEDWAVYDSEGTVAIIAPSCAWVSSAQLAEMAGLPPSLGMVPKTERDRERERERERGRGREGGRVGGREGRREGRRKRRERENERERERDCAQNSSISFVFHAQKYWQRLFG